MSIINNHIATNPKFDASIQSGLESSRPDVSQKGNYRGETVRVHNATQSLFDAMEELTSLGSEKAEKDLTKRKVKDSGVRVNEAHELVSDYLRKVLILKRIKRSKIWLQKWREEISRPSRNYKLLEWVFRGEKPSIPSPKSR